MTGFGELRFILRGFRRDRGYAITAAVTLALALGLNLTVFGIVNAMLFRGFPVVQRNDRLVYLQERNPLGQCCLMYPDFEQWRAEAKSFEAMALVGGKAISFREGLGGRARDMYAAVVSSNAFAVLGVRPALGRDFTPEDETAGAPAVAILSYNFWRASLGQRADIIGRTILIKAPDRINDAPVTVIGVMPEGFSFPEQENLWLPLERGAALERRAPGWYMGLGRLAQGSTVERARAEIEGISQRIAAEYPQTNRDVRPRVSNYAQFFVGPDAAVIYGSLWAAAGFVLLIACANLTNLALARALGRSRELATRLALGAGRGRMARSILAENLLLAGVGGAAAWWIAKGSIQAWADATGSRYQVLDYTVDWGTAAYLAALSLGAALLFSIAPMIRVMQLEVNGAMKGSPQGIAGGGRGGRLAATLIAVQMALAVVLLSGAGVLARSLWMIVGAKVGVEAPEKVLTGLVELPRDKYKDAESRLAFFDALRSRLMAVPGVETAAWADFKPVDNPASRVFGVEGQGAAGAGTHAVAVIAAGVDYFRTLGAGAIEGREFEDRDTATSPAVAIVNQSFAATYFTGEDPVGKRIRLYDGNKPGGWRTIAGVVSSIMQDEPTRQSFAPVVYVPLRQQPAAAAWFFARTAARPAEVMPAVRAEVERADPDVALEDFSTLQASFSFRRDRMDLEHAELGKYASVAPIFAAMALLLAAVGLYAVIAHSVSRRTKEIGVRMAIGAAEGDIRRLIFGEGMRPVGVGVVAGLAASLAVNRILRSQLVGVSPYDAVTLMGSLAVLLTVALLACQAPSRRAMRVDPAVALRMD